LVLLDLALPRLDGVEACRRMRMARPALPILILTARGSEEDRVKGLQAGADDYLTKPFGSAELLARIDALRRRAAIAPSDAERVEIDGCVLYLGRCLAHRNGDALPLNDRGEPRAAARAIAPRRIAAAVLSLSEPLPRSERRVGRTVDRAVAARERIGQPARHRVLSNRAARTRHAADSQRRNARAQRAERGGTNCDS